MYIIYQTNLEVTTLLPSSGTVITSTSGLQTYQVSVPTGITNFSKALVTWAGFKF
jgi:hypothetical protein